MKTALESLLDQLEIEPGSLLFLHTSYSRLNTLVDSPLQLISDLLARLGPSGTLVMPRYAWHLDRTARPWKGYAEYLVRGSVMDLRRAPSNIGAVPEVFRCMDGVEISISYFWPIAAKGRLAREIAEGQEKLDHAYDRQSSFGRLLDRNAIVLGLGVTLNTTSIAPVTDLRVGHPIFTALVAGSVIDLNGHIHETHTSTMLPEAVRDIRPSWVLERRLKPGVDFPFVTQEGSFFFSYPAKLYDTAAVAAWADRRADNTPAPWMAPPRA
jgi:aminoglycoside 3-N-acetyltransferase